MSRLLLSSLVVVILDAICLLLLLSSPRQRGPEFKLLAKNVSFPFASSSPSPVPAPTTTSPFQAPTPSSPPPPEDGLPKLPQVRFRRPQQTTQIGGSSCSKITWKWLSGRFRRVQVSDRSSTR